MKVILTIAGSDSGGGAGIQADLKTISACGAYGASAITAVTAQNTRTVTAAEEVSPALIEAQVDAVFDDFPVAAVKTGMLSSARVIEAVARALGRRRLAHFVLDPVMVSKSGDALLEPQAVDSLRRELFPLATLVTPNRHEAQVLAGVEVRGPADARRAGERLLEAGCRAVLVKGGHFESGRATDVLVSREGEQSFEAEFIDTPHTHGTGCTFSAAIATYLGRGRALPEAIGLAKAYVTEAIRHGLPLGSGHGPTDHFFFSRSPDASSWAERLQLHPSREEVEA
jgi:hydroxymethylpyrimidine/phosphomethylpyrimidine kinase